jgi:predicted site-specific integrase-resolvase
MLRASSAYLTPEEICEDLGIARSTFDEWRAKGTGPRCIKLPNGRLRVRRGVYERWLSDRERTGRERRAA